MSLFPAYADNDREKTSQNTKTEDSWLVQPSFPAVVSNAVIKTDSSTSGSESDVEIIKPKRVKTKKKKEKPKKQKIEKNDENDLYTIDAYRDLGYLNMTKLSKRNLPRYEKPSSSLPGVYIVKKNSKKPIRYFSKKQRIRSGQDDATMNEDLKKTVEMLNTAVRETPDNIENWLKLISFQDDFYKYQPIQFKTDGERDRAIKSQKLSIIERAMAANVENEELSKLWLQLARDCLTSDEIEQKLEELSKINGDRLIMCLGQVMLTQLSMPRCKISPVMLKYKVAMERLQKSRHLSSTEQDNATLELFYYACVFLQQSGLWEMAGTAIKLILHLNLSLEYIDVSNKDKHVLQAEEKIITECTDIPVWHLWTRLELLRQGHHFFPTDNSEYFPQRVVGNEEVVHLVHHVRRSAHFRLLYLLPILTNVPLLPQSHSVITLIWSQLPSWAFDSVEWHLSALFTNSPLITIDDTFLAKHVPKSLPPQYLNNYQGQTEFLNQTIQIFETILKPIADRQRDAIGCWFLRFLRFLNILSKKGIYQHPIGYKKLKSLGKNFVDRVENRLNINFYIEFALLMYETGQINESICFLKTTMKLMDNILEENDKNVKANFLACYRTCCEIEIATGKHVEAKETLKKMFKTESDIICLKKLKQIIESAVECKENEELEDMTLPNLTTEAISCYVYFLTLSGHIPEALLYLNESFQMDLKSFQRENLYKIYIGIIRTFANDKPRSEISIVMQMLREFPYNPTSLMILGETMTNGGGLWWKDMTYLIHMPNNMGAVITVCAVLERQRKSGEKDFRCRGLLERLTSTGNNVSNLVHRINLAKLKELGEVDALESARVLALEAFPWNKDLYIEAISSCPDQLLPLTDLLVEKDLRIHITLDEVEALRN